jgi:hypothetical protein
LFLFNFANVRLCFCLSFPCTNASFTALFSVESERRNKFFHASRCDEGISQDRILVVGNYVCEIEGSEQDFWTKKFGGEGQSAVVGEDYVWKVGLADISVAYGLFFC